MLKKSVVLLLVIAAGLFVAWRLTHRSHKSESVSGTIEVDEVHVASRYGGRVEKLPFDEGAVLQGGEVIAELEAAELHARRDLLSAQLAELEAGPRQEEIEA